MTESLPYYDTHGKTFASGPRKPWFIGADELPKYLAQLEKSMGVQANDKDDDLWKEVDKQIKESEKQTKKESGK